jgi:hypothetical protein
MTRITHIVRLAALAVLAAAAASVVAGSGQAALIDHDSVSTIGNHSFKFKNGDVYWHLSNGKFSAHVVGTLTLKNANGSCARMRLEYFDQGESIKTKEGGPVCAPDGKSHDYGVDLDPYSDDNIDLLKVSVEKKTASGGSAYSIVESAYFSPSTAPDKFTLNSQGVDFGGDEYSSILGEPVFYSADLYWNRVAASADITPRLIGTYWLDNVAGLCARINLRYETESGSYLNEKHDSPFCAADNNLHHVRIDFSPYTSPQVERVEVQLQSQASNGSWNVVRSQTLTIDE